MSKHFKLLFFLLFLLPVLSYGIKYSLDLRKKAVNDYANIQINTTALNKEINPDLWLNFAQGGEQSGTDMVRPVLGHLYGITPQYIRIDHVFDFYDQAKLDDTVQSILIAGARPMFSLSYFPGNNSDMANWTNLVKNLVNRYSVEKRIPNIYYEVWNEPDLFGGFHYAKDPNYMKLYIATANAVAQAAGSSPYKIGGPATTAFYPNWIKSLFKTVKDNGIRLDFVSWHRYSKDISVFENDIDKLNEIIADLPYQVDIETIITESGPDSEKSPWYNNEISGIHFLSLVTRLYGRLDRFFTFEIVDGPNQSDGWGIIHHPDQKSTPKPRYYAFELLHQLTGRVLSSTGNGSWVTSISTRDNNIIKTVLVNYDPKSDHFESVPITYNNLTPGQYKLTTQELYGKTNEKIITVNYTYFNETIVTQPNTAYLITLEPSSGN